MWQFFKIDRIDQYFLGIGIQGRQMEQVRLVELDLVIGMWMLGNVLVELMRVQLVIVELFEVDLMGVVVMFDFLMIFGIEDLLLGQIQIIVVIVYVKQVAFGEVLVDSWIDMLEYFMVVGNGVLLSCIVTGKQIGRAHV